MWKVPTKQPPIKIIDIVEPKKPVYKEEELNTTSPVVYK